MSPNVKDIGNTLARAQADRATPAFRTFLRQSTEAIDDKLGLHTTATSALGDWTDGIEAAVFYAVPDGADWEAVRVSAALKGLATQQKQVVLFHADPAGPDVAYRLHVNQNDVQRGARAAHR